MDIPCYLARKDFQSLIDLLSAEGYECYAPQVKEGTFHYLPLMRVEQLPIGYADVQQPGRFELKQHDDDSDKKRFFAWANGPQAIKPLTFAPRETLWQTTRDADGRLQFVEVKPQVKPTAVIGVRSCDLAALEIQDRVFQQQPYQDPYYSARRSELFLVAVNCSHPAETCFCAATGDGPTADSGYDLLLTELDDGFLIKAGSERARPLLARLPLGEAEDHHHYQAGQQALAAARQTRSLPRGEVSKKLMANLSHQQWELVAQRCLSCGNCTMVCPTCFCHKEHETAAPDGSQSSHSREWDSCFTQDHSYIHGMVVRQETKLRYRQWLTHKFATWHEQFGSSGCVGCGRCISWCPAAIDVTEELAAICESEG